MPKYSLISQYEFLAFPTFLEWCGPFRPGTGTNVAHRILASQRHVQLFRAPTMMSNRVSHVHYLAGPSTAMRMTATALQQQCNWPVLSNSGWRIGLLCTKLGNRLDWLSRVYRPAKHIIGHLEDGFLWVRWLNQPCQSSEGSSGFKDHASVPQGPPHHVNQ